MYYVIKSGLFNLQCNRFKLFPFFKLFTLLIFLNSKSFTEISYKFILMDLQNPYIPNPSLFEKYPPLGFEINESHMRILYNFNNKNLSSVDVYLNNNKDYEYLKLLKSGCGSTFPDSIKNIISSKKDSSAVLLHWKSNQEYEYFLAKQEKNYSIKSFFILDRNLLLSDEMFFKQFESKTVLLNVNTDEYKNDENCFILHPVKMYFPKKFMGISIYFVYTDLKKNYCDLKYSSMLQTENAVNLQVIKGKKLEKEIDSINNWIFEFYDRDSVSILQIDKHKYSCSWFRDKDDGKTHVFQFYEYINGYTFLINYMKSDSRTIPKKSTFIDSIFTTFNELLDNNLKN